MNKYANNITLPNGTNVLIKDLECRPNLSNEVTRATSKETELESAISAETTRATSKETELKNDIDNEMTRAVDAETANTNLIKKEVSGLNEKDTDLQAAINTERDRALSAENSLHSKITDSLNKASEWTTWKELGSYRGSNDIQLPENWNELMVYTFIPNTTAIYYSAHVIKIFVKQSITEIVNTYSSNSDGYYKVQINGTTNILKIAAVYNQTNNVTDESATYVYYR